MKNTHLLLDDLRNVQPTMAELLGVETRELSHNHFFHSLMKDQNLNRLFLMAILRNRQTPTRVRRIVEEPSLQIADVRFQPKVGKKKRADEWFLLRAREGKDVLRVLLEMKVQSPGGFDQLVKYCRTYLETWPDESVLGILVRLNTSPLTEKHESTSKKFDVIFVDLKHYISALEEVAKEKSDCGADAVPIEALNDYLDSCRKLETRDELIESGATEFWSMAKKKDKESWERQWWKDNGAWCCERLIRSIYDRLLSMDSDYDDDHWGGVGTGYKSSYVNFYAGGGGGDGQGIFRNQWAEGPLRSPEMKNWASGFFKLRVMNCDDGASARLELTTITSVYRNANVEMKKIRKKYENSLREKIQDLLDSNRWHRPKRKSSVKNSSGCVAYFQMVVSKPKKMAEETVRLADEVVALIR